MAGRFARGKAIAEAAGSVGGGGRQGSIRRWVEGVVAGRRRWGDRGKAEMGSRRNDAGGGDGHHRRGKTGGYRGPVVRDGRSVTMTSPKRATDGSGGANIEVAMARNGLFW